MRKIYFLIYSIFSFALVIFISMSSVQNNIENVPKERRELTSSKIALWANGDVSKKYLKKMTFETKDNIKFFIYGNKDYGLFQSSDFLKDGDQYTLSFVPPGYKKEINFYYMSTFDQKKKIGTLKFKNPTPKVLDRMIFKLTGAFSTPYMAMSGQLLPAGEPKEVKGAASYVFIINKFGEIVWSHITDDGKTRRGRHGFLRPLGQGIYGNLYGEKTTYFELVNYRGEVLKKIYPQDLRPSQIFHHDFIYEKEKNSILFLSRNTYSRRGYIKDLSFLENLKLFFLKPLIVTSSSIVRYNLDDDRFDTVWRGEKFFNPFDRIDKHHNRTNMDLYDYLVQGGAREWSGNGVDAHIDHIHANSLKPFYKNGELSGHLLTSRNDNRLVMISSDFKSVLWTLGNNSTDTFHILDKKNKIFHPHDGRMLDDSHVIVFDNSPLTKNSDSKGSRIIVFNITKQKNVATRVWRYKPAQNIFSPTRGSVESLENNNFLVHFPRNLDMNHTDRKKARFDDTIEINPYTLGVVAHLRLSFRTIIGHNRQVVKGAGSKAVPMSSIGIEKAFYEN